MEHVLKFGKARETKGCYVYSECDGDGEILEREDQSAAVVGSLYLKKKEIDGTAPDVITVTIAA